MKTVIILFIVVATIVAIATLIYVAADVIHEQRKKRDRSQN